MSFTVSLILSGSSQDLRRLLFALISVSLIDYLCVSGNIDINVLEWVDHLHNHFTHPASVNKLGHYNVGSLNV